MKKVNLGCGTYYLLGFINIDMCSEGDIKPDIMANVKSLPFEDESIDFIYAGHLLEHLYYDLVPEYLKEWQRVLKAGGQLVIVVPDLGISMKRYAAGVYHLDHLLPQIFGQHYSYDREPERHRYIYDWNRLVESVSRIPWKAYQRLDFSNPPEELKEHMDHKISRVDWQMGIILVKAYRFNKKKVCIVIPCINLWKKYTKPCIDSIISSHPYEIMLLDNASSDETESEAVLLKGKIPLIYQRNSTNWGTSRSWNAGINYGFEHGADYVFVINNDILLHPNCIDRLVERFERKDENVVMVTAMDVRGECANPTDLFSMDDRAKEQVPKAEHPHFSAFMINKKCWEEVGEFDEGFYPAYFEDNSYHYRIRLAGLKAITYPPALFYHYGSRTQNEAIHRPVVLPGIFDKNREYYVMKWGGGPTQERFKYPFNDPNKNIKWTYQSITPNDKDYARITALVRQKII